MECPEDMFLGMVRESDDFTSHISGTSWKTSGELESLVGMLARMDG